ncbi:MAG: hypothetical protein ACOYXU_02045 [Nitrospirota bacterium]
MTETNDFDAAKAISDQLKGMEKDRQQRILRWVAESLDITLHVKTPSHEPATEKASAHGGLAIAEPVVPAARAPDIKTFVESKRPKSDMQFATVVAYYYCFEADAGRRSETLTADQLLEAARLSGWNRPPRPSMTLNNAKNQGYLDSAGKGAFRINSVGENLVAMTLPGENGKPPARGAAPRRRAKNKAAKPRGR